MEPFQVGSEDLPVDQHRAVKAVDGSGIAGEFQQLLVGQAVNQLCLLVADEFSAEFAQMVRYFLHAMDGLIAFFHGGILQIFNWNV